MTLLSLFAFAGALVSTAQAGTCSVPLDQFTAKVDRAEGAYASFEVDAFSSSMDEAALMLPCLTAVVPTDASAHYLRLLGIQYFIERASGRADQVFAGARSADPAYVFPETLIPTGHPLRSHYSAIDLNSLKASPIPLPRAGAIAFNGVPALSATPERPGFPAIVQVVDSSGAITATSVAFPGDALPPYEVMPAAPVAVAPLPKTAPVATSDSTTPPGLDPTPLGADVTPGPVRKKHTSVVLAVATGFAAGGAGALYLVAGAGAQQFKNGYSETDTNESLAAQRGAVNGLVGLSAGVGVLAIAGGVGAVLVGKW